MCVLQGGFTERQAAQILRGLMLFLAHVHSRGIAHMDIKVGGASRARRKSLMAVLNRVKLHSPCVCGSVRLSGKEAIERHSV